MTPLRRHASTIVLSFFITTSSFSLSANEDILSARRIAQLYHSKEWELCDREIHRFLNDYPDSRMLEDVLTLKKELAGDAEDHPTPQLTKNGDVPENIVEFLPKNGENWTNEQQKDWAMAYADSLSEEAERENSHEAKKRLYAQAREWYERLNTGKYSTLSKVGLAEIYRFFGENKKAISTYLDLAKELPSARQELMYEAASLQATFDKKAALLTLSEADALCMDEKECLPLQKARTMYRIGAYRKLADEAEELLKVAAADERALLREMIGYACFSLKDYPATIKFLSPIYSEEASTSSIDNQSVLLTLIASYRKTGDIESLERSLSLLAIKCPSKPEAIAKGLYLQLLAYQDSKRCEDIPRLLTELEESYPDLVEKELLFYEQGMLCYNCEYWNETIEIFTKFIELFPKSDKTASVSASLCNSHMNRINLLGERNNNDLEEEFATALDTILSLKSVHSKKAKEHYLFLLADNLYAIKEYEAALPLANCYIDRYPESEKLAHMLTLAGLCHLNGQKDREAFITYAEKALALNTEMKEETATHFNLFASYLSLANSTVNLDNDSKQKTYILEAADHLYQVLAAEPMHPEVSIQQKWWLAQILSHPFLDDPKKEMSAEEQSVLNKAIDVLTLVVQENSIFEEGLFTLSQLFEIAGRPEDRLKTLEHLTSKQREHPNAPWAMQYETTLGLGKSLATVERNEEAAECYQSLIKDPKTPKNIYSTSVLNLVRQRWAQVSPDERNAHSKIVQDILVHLEKLKSFRDINDEPIYLEAAIEAAHIKASLDSPISYEETLLDLLVDSKNLLTRETTITDRNYHRVRKEQPKLDSIYQSYLLLMDAHITRLQSLLAMRYQAHSEYENMREAAFTMYTNLLKGSLFTTPYLVKEARRGVKETSPAYKHKDLTVEPLFETFDKDLRL